MKKFREYLSQPKEYSINEGVDYSSLESQLRDAWSDDFNKGYIGSTSSKRSLIISGIEDFSLDFLKALFKVSSDFKKLDWSIIEAHGGAVQVEFK